MDNEPKRCNPDSSRGRPRLWLALGLLWAVSLSPRLAEGSGPPEVLPVRVPSDQVSRCFPAGTELRGLSAEGFEALVRSAREGFDRQEGLASPRLLRARHFARWDPVAGLLTGRSELVVERFPAGPGALVLSPWTPAIEFDPASPQVEAFEDGKTAVRVNAATTTALIRWQLRARPSSRGRGFTLGLPATAMASLVLDLPDGWIPDGPQGIRQGPEPAGDSRRKTWQFDGTGGPIDLQFRNRGDGRDTQGDARIWVSGPTRIDLLETSANWTTDWTVDTSRRGPRQFAIELDAGLELIDVTGAGVEEYQVEALGSSTRVKVRLDDAVGTPTTVSIHAVTRVPALGAWIVPSARPLDALWTGGTTSVRLNVGRTLEECRERSGRRIASPASERAIPTCSSLRRASRCRWPSWSSACRRPRSRPRSGAGSW